MEMPAPGLPPGTAFDIVSDVHGCFDELAALLTTLGYRRPARPGSVAWTAARGRHLVIAGDIVARGPAILDTVELVEAMIGRGDASAVVGNHDDKLLRWLRGRPVKVSQGLEASIREVDGRPKSYRAGLEAFLASLPSHMVVDDTRLVVAHAGLPERLHGVHSDKARDFAMYGAVREGRDEWALPIRLDWAAEYRGTARIVYGHTPRAGTRQPAGRVAGERASRLRARSHGRRLRVRRARGRGDGETPDRPLHARGRQQNLGAG